MTTIRAEIYDFDHDSRSDGALVKARALTGDSLHLVSYSGDRPDMAAVFNTTKLEDRIYWTETDDDLVGIGHCGTAHHVSVPPGSERQHVIQMLNDAQAITPAEVKAAEECSMTDKWSNFRRMVQND